MVSDTPLHCLGIVLDSIRGNLLKVAPYGKLIQKYFSGLFSSHSYQRYIVPDGKNFLKN